MIVRVKCGEIYDFYMIKSITDNGNGTIEIVGNFKPRGRYKHVVLWKMSILNFSEITSVYNIDLKPYFCLKCKRTHRENGKVYNEHIKHMGKKKDLIPCDRIINANLKRLSWLGRRQFANLMKQIEFHPNRADVYRQKINQLLIYEGVNLEDVLPKNV